MKAVQATSDMLPSAVVTQTIAAPGRPHNFSAAPSQLMDFAVIRELCLGVTVTSSLPVAGHQGSSAVHPKQQLSREDLEGKMIRLIIPAGSAHELMSFEKQLSSTSAC